MNPSPHLLSQFFTLMAESSSCVSAMQKALQEHKKAGESGDKIQEGLARENVHSCVDSLLDKQWTVAKLLRENPSLRK